jgi:hypothetical protein
MGLHCADFTIEVNRRINELPCEQGLMGGHEIFRDLMGSKKVINLPKPGDIRPHHNAIEWHRKNIFNPSNI